MHKSDRLGKISRFIASFFVVVIIIFLILNILSVIKLGQEVGYDLLIIKIIPYSIVVLYLIYGAFALFKNIRKSFPITILVIFILLNYELLFPYVSQINPPGFIEVLPIIIFYLIPLILVVMSLRNEKNDGADGFIKKLLSSKDKLSTKAKMMMVLYGAYAVTLVMISGGFLNLYLLKISNTSDVFIVMSQKSSNSAVIICVLTIIFLLLYFLIKIFFKEEQPENSTKRLTDILE